MGSFGERGWACPELTGGGVAARAPRDPGDLDTEWCHRQGALLGRGLHTA